MAHIYIHIPFCQRICSYCDFPKRVSKTTQIDDYLLALEKEVKMYNINDKVQTLYLGGGTPSILNETQLAVLKRIVDQFVFSEDFEFTIECNPEHITSDKLNFYKTMGVNRISLGVQTFNERLLKLLNRGHISNDILNAVKVIKNSGINNISIDLIYAIPMQTLSNLKQDLEIIKDLEITHISAYSLILEEKTVFAKMVNDNKLTLVDNDLEAEMYKLIMDTLKDYGYNHYEISNYAKANYQSIHNKVYWQNKNYYGFGMGASGYINNVRYYNENMVNNYLEKVTLNQLPVMTNDHLTKDCQIKEALMLGLRLIDGVLVSELNQRYQINILDYFKEQFKILQTNDWISITDRIRLTEKGLFLGNEVFELFI